MTTYPVPTESQADFTATAGGTRSDHAKELGRINGAWENIRHFGTKADGSDDAAAIQAAIDAANGGTVYAPPGTYYIGTPLELVTGTRFIGAGRDVTIFKCYGANTTVFAQTTVSLQGFYCADFSIDGTGTETGFLFNGQYATLGSWERIAFTTLAWAFDFSPNGELVSTATRGCTFSNSPVRYYTSTDINHNLWEMCRFTTFSQNTPAFTMEMPTTSRVNALARIVSCDFESLDRSAIRLVRASTVSVEDCWFENINTDHQTNPLDVSQYLPVIESNGVLQMRVEGNYFNNVGAYAEYIAATEANEFSTRRLFWANNYPIWGDTGHIDLSSWENVSFAGVIPQTIGEVSGGRAVVLEQPLHTNGLHTDGPYIAGRYIDTAADSFDRANSNTTLGTADTGGAWTVDGTSVFGIASNNAKFVSGSGTFGGAAYFTMTGSNYTVQADITTSNVSSDAGLEIRATPTHVIYATLVTVNMQPNPSTGVPTNYPGVNFHVDGVQRIYHQMEILPSTTYTLKMTALGSAVQVEVDGTIIFTYDLTTAEQVVALTGRRVGLFSSALEDGASRWDNFDAQELPVSVLAGGYLASRLGYATGNSATASSVGTVTHKMEVFDLNGNSLGFVPIYGSIT